jgi:hypothetical protein
MASAIEALGMSLPFSSSAPADSEEKRTECKAAGKVQHSTRARTHTHTQRPAYSIFLTLRQTHALRLCFACLKTTFAHATS